MRPLVRARAVINDPEIAVEAPGWQGARRARTRRYATDEQRRQPGWIDRENGAVITARALSLTLLVASCASSGQLDRGKGFGGDPAKDVSVDQVPVHGHEVRVEHRSDDGMVLTEGELLAVDAMHLWIRTRSGTITIPRGSIRAVEVELHPSGAVAAGLWTAGGTISTVSHGFFLVLTGPLWLITGISATSSAAASNDLEVKPRDLSELYQYARFPQGLPAGWR